MLIHASGFNLSLLIRELIGCGTPRGLQGLSSVIFALTCVLQTALQSLTKLWLVRNRRIACDSEVTPYRLVTA